jgi:hypothetical protein
LQTGQSEEAARLARQGISKGGEYAASYRAMLEALPDLQKSIKRQTNAAGGPPG